MTNYTDISAGQELFTNATTLTYLLNTDWLLGLIITILALVLITRNVSRWAELAFPITLLLGIAGIKVSLLQYIFSAVIFAVQIMNYESFGNFIDSLPFRKKEIKYEKLVQKEEKRRQSKELKGMGPLAFAQLLGTAKKSKEKRFK